jgi:hypothetical protein
LGIIAERVAEGLPQPEPRPSKLDRILSSLDDEDRAIVLGWLHDNEVGTEDVEERLRACGIHCSDSTVRRWRRQNVTAWVA